MLAGQSKGVCMFNCCLIYASHHKRTSGGAASVVASTSTMTVPSLMLCGTFTLSPVLVICGGTATAARGTHTCVSVRVVCVGEGVGKAQPQTDTNSHTRLTQTRTLPYFYHYHEHNSSEQTDARCTVEFVIVAALFTHRERVHAGANIRHARVNVRRHEAATWLPSCRLNNKANAPRGGEVAAAHVCTRANVFAGI